MQIIDQTDSPTTSQCKLDDKSYHETLALIRGIEAAGGEAGFVEWATRSGYPAPSHTLALAPATSTTKPSDPSPISIRVTMGTLALHTFVRCRIPGWHGAGGAWGVGLAAFACTGTLDIDTALTGKLYVEKFTAATVAVRVVAAGEGSATALLVFADEAGHTVGSAVLSGLGIGAAVGFTGKFSWSEDQEEKILAPLT
ncbi:hypothetical protein FIBSPDRAFT_956813 [Athelia psychrophila]|uniref:Uncharacterized protein n=1 Tax=Athelia psychrophila TaxID=1759441 RepID=A0A166GIV6_9AGAM|nr:hypothetical protein FIBSPDRAFT_956813 [Fibularhizoctonia sp. CBS 109695]